MKILNIILTVFFALFAVVQLNDDTSAMWWDPFIWALFYGFVAVVSGFAIFGKYHQYIILAGLAVSLIWAATLLPKFIDWINLGMPSITGQMKVTDPYIENTREFLGLLLAALTLYWHYARARRKPAALI